MGKFDIASPRLSRQRGLQKAMLQLGKRAATRMPATCPFDLVASLAALAQVTPAGVAWRDAKYLHRASGFAPMVGLLLGIQLISEGVALGNLAWRARQPWSAHGPCVGGGQARTGNAK